jgi:ParB-like chromosome segregation protein Spo0J
MNYRTDADYKAVADTVPVFCAHDKIVDIKKLIPNPRNPNTHPEDQIALLAQIIRQTGWRAPITVSTASGYVVKGRGRLLAAKSLGLKRVPVDYQNYASEAEEYADPLADNRIAELAEIDRQQLADHLCVERSALSAEISRLSSLGLITSRKSHFTLRRTV